jgi:hypothetical protein
MIDDFYYIYFNIALCLSLIAILFSVVTAVKPVFIKSFIQKASQNHSLIFGSLYTLPAIIIIPFLIMTTVFYISNASDIGIRDNVVSSLLLVIWAFAGILLPALCLQKFCNKRFDIVFRILILLLAASVLITFLV